MSIASMFDRPQAYYGPNGPGSTVPCRDCGFPADVLFGGHGGQCLDQAFVAIPGTALGLIYRHAQRHGRFSANDLRNEPGWKDTNPASRGPAFGAAERKGYVENDGYVRSTDGPTKGHPVAVYRSLVYRAGAA